MTSRRRDSQRSKTYLWEGRHYRKYKRNKPLESMVKIQDYVNDVVQQDCPEINEIIATASKRSKGTWAWARIYDRPRKIVLPQGWGRKTSTILHEVAHHFVDYADKDLPLNQQATFHGPEFVSVYMYLMQKHAGYSIESALKAALRYKVKHHPSLLDGLLSDNNFSVAIKHYWENK